MYSVIPLMAALGPKIDSVFYGLDTAIFTFFGNMQTGFLTYVAKFFTSFGDEDFVIPIAVLAVVLCLFKRTRKYGFSILMAVAVGTVITNLALKPMVERVRPYNTLQLTDFWSQYSVWYKNVGSLSESDFSFPSGHTTSAFEMAIAACLCFASDKKKKVAWIFPAVATCTMGSRIYLMVHYPTDVIFGCVAGCVAGVAGYFIAKLICKIFEKVEFLDKIDAEKIFKKGINTKVASALIAIVIVITLGYSFTNLLSESDEIKCAYNGTYDCNNKARIDSEKYPALDIDGDGENENVCKIHWREFSEQ